MTATVTDPSTRDCGGSARTAGCPGGCGCGGGEARAPSGGYTRPRFFAGQVLLDDDLAAIESYVVGKNRLHNRFLHGDGVVCGLDVTCHPCGGGTALVSSGYALDCGGNDIVVPCREELDIVDMIRRLRTATNGGFDCGPCETTTGESDTRYWLYVRQIEQLSDPVEPYATDAGCGPAGCEPTRIREGYRFLLRSHRCPEPVDDLLGRILACIGSHQRLPQVLAAGRWVRLLGDRLTIALTAAQAQAAAAPDLTAPEVNRVQAFATGAADALPAGTPAEVARLVDDLSATAALVVRARTMSAAARKAAGPTDDQIDAAATALADAARKLTDAKATDQLDASAKPFAEASFRTATRAAGLRSGQAMAGDLTLLGKGVAVDNRLLRDAVGELRRHRQLLLEAASRPGTTDCLLAADVAAVRIPEVKRVPDDSGEGVPEDPAESKALADAAERLNRLTIRYLISCACAALNPPCRDCADDAVLLAAIDVEDCVVRKICQVSRRTVPSGPALRYWLSLDRLPALLEKACCPEEVERPVPVERPIENRFLSAVAAAPADDRLRTLIELGRAVVGPQPQAEALLDRALELDLPAQQQRIATLETELRERIEEVHSRLAELRDELAKLRRAPAARPAARKTGGTKP
ncbi:hypothetical protein ACIBQ1_03525 [Nonomuraea sp. NPDC050153]|uniref:hypothetical protein n=1 Tax=Nonomuraea sp. NPDC050153 TaxID=3364359 RepID=UPI0037880E39